MLEPRPVDRMRLRRLEPFQPASRRRLLRRDVAACEARHRSCLRRPAMPTRKQRRQGTSHHGDRSVVSAVSYERICVGGRDIEHVAVVAARDGSARHARRYPGGVVPVEISVVVPVYKCASCIRRLHAANSRRRSPRWTSRTRWSSWTIGVLTTPGRSSSGWSHGMWRSAFAEPQLRPARCDHRRARSRRAGGGRSSWTATCRIPRRRYHASTPRPRRASLLSSGAEAEPCHPPFRRLASVTYFRILNSLAGNSLRRRLRQLLHHLGAGAARVPSLPREAIPLPDDPDLARVLAGED